MQSPRGRSQTLTPQLETNLVDAVKRMEAMGLGPTMHQFRIIVKDYVLLNNISCRFKDGMPGPDWVNNFMKRHNLMLKKGGQMQIARKNVTSDPFVINGFYDTIQAQMENLNITDRPECVYNLDETSFPTDPSKRKTIGTKGQKTVRVTCGANRENTTVLATCCADGTSHPPLIIFKGQRMQTTWQADNPVPGTQYAATPNGWMTTEVFEQFFQKFAQTTSDKRPLLLILDGHVTHLSYKTITLGIEENITILKLPAHCTDLLQPLDIACFAPLKNAYETELQEHVHSTGAHENLTKAKFADLLGKVWAKGLSPANIKAGFRATGIMPLDRTKYHTDRLDPIKLITYNKWVEEGRKLGEDGSPILTTTSAVPSYTYDKSESENEDLITTASTSPGPLPQQATASTSRSLVSSPLPLPVVNQAIQAVDNAECNHSFLQIVRRMQSFAPPGHKYHISLIQENAPIGVSIEAVLQGRGRQAKTPTHTRRSVISNYGEVVTSEECVKRTRENKQKAIQQK